VCDPARRHRLLNWKSQTDAAFEHRTKILPATDRDIRSAASVPFFLCVTDTNGLIADHARHSNIAKPSPHPAHRQPMDDHLRLGDLPSKTRQQHWKHFFSRDASEATVTSRIVAA
jgi:hypothetical protein